MATATDLHYLTIFLSLTAVLASVFVIVQIAITYTTAYIAAPNEILTFVDAVDFSIQENESYDKDVGKVQRLEDKLRLGKLLREIQKCGDDLREDLNGLLIDESATRMRSSTRIFWAAKKGRLEGRVRRLDMLRMRFLVVYMGLVAAKSSEHNTPARDPEKQQRTWSTPTRPSIQHALTEGITRNPPPLRRLTTQAMGHNEHAGTVQKLGWLGVVAELQNSPRMHKRHASVENALASPT